MKAMALAAMWLSVDELTLSWLLSMASGLIPTMGAKSPRPSLLRYRLRNAAP